MPKRVTPRNPSGLPSMTEEGRARIKAMLARRDEEMKGLELLAGDSKMVLEDFQKREPPFDGKNPLVSILQSKAVMLACLVDWMVGVQRTLVVRLYNQEHVLLHLLYSTERPVRGTRLKELQALLGDHGVRLLSLEEEVGAVHQRLGAAIGDLSRRIALGSTLESDTKGPNE